MQCFATGTSERGAEGKCTGPILISYYGFPSFIVLAGQTHGNLPKVSFVISMIQVIHVSVLLYVPDSFLPTLPWISAISSLASLPSSRCREDGSHFTFVDWRSLSLLFTFRCYESSPFPLVSSYKYYLERVHKCCCHLLESWSLQLAALKTYEQLQDISKYPCNVWLFCLISISWNKSKWRSLLPKQIKLSRTAYSKLYGRVSPSLGSRNISIYGLLVRGNK